MKVNIEIEDDSKFLEALAEEMRRSKDKAVVAGDDAKPFELDRIAGKQGFSCVAISCNN